MAATPSDGRIDVGDRNVWRRGSGKQLPSNSAVRPDLATRTRIAEPWQATAQAEEVEVAAPFSKSIRECDRLRRCQLDGQLEQRGQTLGGAGITRREDIQPAQTAQHDQA